jgi:hypothetical protein
MPHRKTSTAVSVTAYDNFLCLLTEMEASLKRGTIQWTAESAETAQRRLANLLADVGAIAMRLRPD